MTLFEVEPVKPMGRDARRTAKQRAIIAQGFSPATGLVLLDGDSTCGDCVKQHVRTWDGRRFFKCEILGFSHGPGTDIRLSWPACAAFRPRSDVEGS